jgi:cytochrome c
VNHLLSACALVILSALLNFSYRRPAPENHKPSVKIMKPLNLAAFPAGTAVSYQVSVADPEDGDSKYDEINAKEVILEVRFINEKSGKKNNTGKPGPMDTRGLSIIAISNCFNCHNFTGKAIGPSFFEISKRYPETQANTDTLTARIRNGSSGIWGKEKMPSHPELSVEQIKATVQWIMKNSAVRDISYYNGLSGIIQFAANKKGTFLLTAGYTDHGIPGEPGKNLTGFDRVMLKLK